MATSDDILNSASYYNGLPDDTTKAAYLQSLQSNPSLYTGVQAALQAQATPAAVTTTLVSTTPVNNANEVAQDAISYDSDDAVDAGAGATASTSTDASTSLTTALTSTSTTTLTDTRVRLSAIGSQADQVYGVNDQTSNILAILHETNGLLFPYSPAITMNQDVEWESQKLVHTNQDINTYTRTPSVKLSVTAKFTIQNQREGQYALAAIHFLRTVSKMYFGEADKAAGLAGLPPPVLLFSGYGNYMFDNIPVVLSSHSWSYDENMDTVLVTSAGGTAKLPPLFSVQLELLVQQTPQDMRKVFSLDAFRTGALMRNAGSGRGWL